MGGLLEQNAGAQARAADEASGVDADQLAGRLGHGDQVRPWLVGATLRASEPLWSGKAQAAALFQQVAYLIDVANADGEVTPALLAPSCGRMRLALAH